MVPPVLMIATLGNPGLFGGEGGFVKCGFGPSPMTSIFSVFSWWIPMLYPLLSLRTMWFGSVYSDRGNNVPSRTSPDFVVILMMLPISALALLSRRRISPWYPSSPEADMALILPRLYPAGAFLSQ